MSGIIIYVVINNHIERRGYNWNGAAVRRCGGAALPHHLQNRRLPRKNTTRYLCTNFITERQGLMQRCRTSASISPEYDAILRDLRPSVICAALIWQSATAGGKNQKRFISTFSPIFDFFFHFAWENQI